MKRFLKKLIDELKTLYLCTVLNFFTDFKESKENDVCIIYKGRPINQSLAGNLRMGQNVSERHWLTMQ